MISVCLPSDALLQHLPSYLGFSYLGHGVSLHGCSSKAQPLLLTLDDGYLLTTALPDFHRGIAPLGPPAPTQPQLLRMLLLAAACSGLGRGCLLPAPALGLELEVAPQGHRPWPRARGGFSRPQAAARAGALSAAERSFPTSEVRGSGLECQAVMAQEQPRGATPRPRSVVLTKDKKI